MEFFMILLIASLFTIYLIGLTVTLCFRRWGIHDYTHYDKEEK